MKKVKETTQNISKAVVSGSRSGSGEIVDEFPDKLIHYGEVLPPQSPCLMVWKKLKFPEVAV